MIDLQTETGLSLVEAARTIPPSRGGRPTNPSTIFRWITRGTTGPAGEKVRLEAVRRPSGWLTSAEAIARFFAALTPDLGDDSRPAPRSAAKRRTASERAARELTRLGI
jgi:hypothetical protein